jgi:hypothetical protein
MILIQMKWEFKVANIFYTYVNEISSDGPISKYGTLNTEEGKVSVTDHPMIDNNTIPVDY